MLIIAFIVLQIAEGQTAPAKFVAWLKRHDERYFVFFYLVTFRHFVPNTAVHMVCKNKGRKDKTYMTREVVRGKLFIQFRL